ncbi:hypothetical protein [Nonomuraea angiospora]
MIISAIDRYGTAAVWRDMSKLSQCPRRCLEATGARPLQFADVPREKIG